MKGKSIDVNFATRVLNECREQYGTIEFDRANLIKTLSSKLQMAETTVETKYLKGLVKFAILNEKWVAGKKMYSFNQLLDTYKKPRVENALFNKKQPYSGPSREECITYLKSLGYKILERGKFNADKARDMLGDKAAECYDYEEI